MKTYKFPIILFLVFIFFTSCDKVTDEPLVLENVFTIEEQAQKLFKQDRDPIPYLDSLKSTSSNKNLSFYLEILSIKFDKKNSVIDRLEKYKKHVKRSFLGNSDSYNKFKIRKEIASLLLNDISIYQGINQMLIGISEIENESVNSTEYNNLIVEAYKKIVNTTSLNKTEKEFYTKKLMEYIPASGFHKLRGCYYSLGYYNFENNEIETAIENFRKSINLKPDSSIIDENVVATLLEEQRNISWGNSYPYLIDCYSTQPDTAYKYIAEMNRLYKNNKITEATTYRFKLHVLKPLISLGDYKLALKYIDELLLYFNNSCLQAYNMTKVYKQKARLHKHLNQKQNQLKALNKWFEYSSCPRTHEYFEIQKSNALDAIIAFHIKTNNKEKVSYYQKLKIEFLELDLLKFEDQRKRSRPWSDFEFEVEKNKDKYQRLIIEFEESRFFRLASITLVIIGLLFYILFLNRSLKKGEIEIVEKQNLLNKTNESLEKSNILISDQNDHLDLQKAQIETKLKKNLFFANFLSSEVESIIEDIKTVESGKTVSLYKLKNRIERIVRKKMTDEINLEFQEKHKDFVHKLCQRHPNLTSTNIRLCILLKLNTTTKEISIIEGKTMESIKVARNRLRKKLMIHKQDISFSDYLNNTI